MLTRATFSVLLFLFSDGVRKSGMYVCIAYIIDKLNDDEEVDVFSTVKEIRRYNPKFIINPMQYKCLYDVVCQYINNGDEYGANEVTYV